MIAGIDVEQFVRYPYATGIQRVLQQLARHWPSDVLDAEFIVPVQEGFARFSPPQMATLVDLVFQHRGSERDLREVVNDHVIEVTQAEGPRPVSLGELLSMYDRWVLPEVSYLPSVLERFEIFQRCMPTLMIGFDALPMTNPENYRFVPGTAANVSRYFRLLASATSVVCISEYSMEAILNRLRRDPALAISVAHPGGDHVEARDTHPPARPRFVRLGTLEARKRPAEILAGFRQAVDEGLAADLVFIGDPSASDASVNAAVLDAIAAGYPVQWIQGADDETVTTVVNESSVFLSLGFEGYGIPVLESIREGTPVVFSGIQPAGELMVGHGARRAQLDSVPEIAQMFLDFCDADTLEGLRTELDPDAVPTWQDFVTSVAVATRDAH